jgi:hypothetical protein
VLHTLETSGGTPVASPQGEEPGAEEDRGVYQQMIIRLLSRAAKEGDWGLGMELARFLVALDGTGDMLRDALEGVGLKGKVEEREGRMGMGSGLGLDGMMNGGNSSDGGGSPASGLGIIS